MRRARLVPALGLLAAAAVALLAARGAAGAPSGLSPEQRGRVQQDFATGRPDLIDATLSGATSPEDLYPLALRDLWWREGAEEEARERWRTLAARAEGLVGRQYRWLLGGARGPYPQSGSPRDDPWFVLTTLVLDRMRREVGLGVGDLPHGSPLAVRPGPPEWPEYEAWRDALVTGLLAPLWRGGAEAGGTEEERAAQKALDERAAGLRRRNLVLGALCLVLFVGGTLLAGRLVRVPDGA